ncbi:uncharacterized protein [Haliotis cracherodii]|uniref:uncharacterized protein n=1 Tax=Haliotis cracherodii TaxID=6455 RepID=UPI0039E8D41C
MATTTSEIVSSAMSNCKQTKLTEKVSKNRIQEVNVKSFDHNPPHFWQVANSFDNIQHHVFQEGRMCIYPVVAPGFDDKVLIAIRERLLAISCHTGFAFTARSMAVSANINSKPKPKEALYDVILFLTGKPTTVFTVIEDRSTRKAKCEALKYTQSIAKGLVKGIRQLTDEQFSVVFGLLTKTDVTDDVLFCHAIDAIKAKTSRLCVPVTLAMPEQKYLKVTRAFLMSVAITDCVCSEGEDSLWFLTLNQFCALTHNIDAAEVELRTHPSCGRKVLLLEVAKRLQKSGPTLLVLQSEALVKAASRVNICSCILHADNVTKEIMKEKIPGIVNIVTDSDVIGLLQNMKIEGSVWYFQHQLLPDLKPPKERTIDIGVLPKDNLGCLELQALPGCGHRSWLRKQCLWKKGRMFHWPKVFVVLCEGCLYYYYKETASAPVGSFSLYGYNSVSRAFEIPPKEAPWVFKLVHAYSDYKTYLFSASSEKEMKECMKMIKTELVLANLGTTRPIRDLGDYSAEDSNIYSEIESDIYINVQEFVVPQSYTTKRNGDYSEDADLCRIRERAIAALISRDKGGEQRRGTPDGASVEKKEQADTPALTDPDAVSEKKKKNYWGSIHYLRSDKEKASSIIQTLGEDGVYLVRDGTDGQKVLVVFLEGSTRKFRICFEEDVYFLESNKAASFLSLEELMYHYHSANLPRFSTPLITPYQLHPMYSMSLL